ncbi:MAG: hypothetical protein U9O90_03750, partial [Euryarchaeota archaeon]|nr:hypothetical protein [Euryarchaeota archaeon]
MKLSLLAMAIVLAAVVLMTIVPVTAGPSDTWTCYLEPRDSTWECDAPTIVSVKINITHTGYYGWHDLGNGVCSYQDDIHYDLSCVNVTDVNQSMAPFLMCSVPRSSIAQRVKIPSVLFTRIGAEANSGRVSLARGNLKSLRL